MAIVIRWISENKLIIMAVDIVLIFVVGWVDDFDAGWKLFPMIFLSIILLGIAFTFLIGKKSDTTIQNIPEFHYRCNACGAKYTSSDVPLGHVCPLDHITLEQFDPVEERNTSPL
ncbi:hypothetical protein KKF61_00090 [Patescibacteria group bacterium]|nr:hypothetical protein [Patescibacteria group bacterium]MBU0964049.1 hypothetical protein [Patescibacteria group bacterium]